ncbi:MAG: hypothetical protein J5767_15550, partial [Paludibacteraceae bacterium]|nr:hypothetical protein [Paludibacteraceae bacterium]
AGLCSAGAPLIGASIVACYARASLEASSNVTSGEGSRPSNYWSSERRGLTGLDYPESRQKSAIANWEIDELQEQLIEQWARAANLWENDSEKILVEAFGPKIAEGAEAKVYYRSGDTCVVKERASIYSTTQKALEAIVLHNCLFPETTMRVIGFTRDSDHIFRIVLTQPYISCKRLASKEEIDELAFSKGFHDNWNGEGVNYISERIALEDMHPANVFIDDVTCKPICIDCIVKFVNSY